jgi:RNA polymerase sigma-54 factor
MAEQTFNHNQTQTLKQEQVLSPQQYQSLEILLTPLLELQEKISQEIAMNPLLEQDSDRHLELAGDLFGSGDPPARQPSADDDGSFDDAEALSSDELAQFSQLARNWNEGEYEPGDASRISDDQERRDYMFNSLVDLPSLQDQMLTQLRLSDMPERLIPVAEIIIGSIDDSGYLRSNLPDIAMAANCEPDAVEEALHLVQAFDPPGIGARDPRECLLLQIDRQAPPDRLLRELVSEHLDAIGRNHLPQIAKAMKISMEELDSLLDKLKKLNPFPGNAIAPDSAEYVVPEMSIERDEHGEYQIADTGDYIPRLRISQTYMDLLEDPTTDRETRDYIRSNLANAKTLLRSLDQRQDTIHRITRVIVDTQHDFFENGIEGLRPLTLQQVADKLDIHGATVSRAIANKYLKTPWGVFEYKFFFSGGYRTEDGGEISSRTVKEKIRELIKDETPEKPLSDSKLEKLLKDDGMVNIARRTVAKYREELGIPPSHLRKKFL